MYTNWTRSTFNILLLCYLESYSTLGMIFFIVSVLIAAKVVIDMIKQCLQWMAVNRGDKVYFLHSFSFFYFVS